MRRFLLIGLLPGLLAADTWVKYASGPFELFTDANTNAARAKLVELEEFRNAVGKIIGENDLQTPEPIRVMVFKNAKGWTSPGPLTQGRDRYAIVLEEKSEISPETFVALTRLFLRSNTTQMPPAFEHGLEEFFSTFSVKGIHITVGSPPLSPDLDWARVHLLVVDPEYYGRIHILLFNLRKGVDEDPAYRNAFGKTPGQIEEQVKQHFLDHDIRTTSIDSRPMAEKDFNERQVSSADFRLARADLLAGDQSAADYESLLKEHLKVAESEEGLGILALRAHKNDEARSHFQSAIAVPGASARCYIEYAKLEPDDERAFAALRKAAGLNPKLDEPLALMAERDTDPQLRLVHWRDAAARNPRNPLYWKSLAECYMEAHNYVEAAKAWREAEQASTDPAEREKMHQARMGVESQRLDYEEAERRRKAEADAREMARLKGDALAEVHALEEKYGGSGKPPENPVPWWTGPDPTGKVTGTLKQVDCIGKQARLLVEGDDRKSVRLLVADPKVSIVGGGEHAFSCGAQKPRRVIIEYFPKADPKTATAGEVATIQFQ
jgi:tetratricopeptide (TPR) repeat protein